MSKRQKLLEKVLSGSRNIAFSEILQLAEGFGFRLVRVSVRQFLDLIERYNLHLED